MKLLITGAAGGIGSTLGYELYKIGFDLILVDNFRNGYRQNLVKNGQTFGRFFELCINSDSFQTLIEKERPQVVIHLAAITSLPDCESKFRECIRVNVEGTASVLGACAKYGVERVIFGSTSAVYENTKISDSGFNESDLINPKLFYSLSKKMSEELCSSFRDNYGLDVVILRFFNVFGPNQDMFRKNPPVINYIVKELFNKRSPILHSDGSQKRDYVYIDDVVNIIKICIESNKNLFEQKYIFNVCSGTTISLNDIIFSIKETNDEFTSLKETFRESNKLWDNYPELFSGVHPLKKSVVEKETNKESIGNNQLIKKYLKYDCDVDINDKIKLTSMEIQKKIKND